MEWMVFDDVTNILLLCLLMGVGVATLLVILLLYIGSLFFMEELND